jgi:hypothetical protein
MPTIARTRLSAPIQNLIEIVTDCDSNEQEKTLELLRMMEEIASRIDDKVWYQENVVSDLII